MADGVEAAPQVRGTWDQVLAYLLATEDADGGIDWTVSLDSTINRAHQHATNTTRPDKPTGAATARTCDPDDPVAGGPVGHAVGRSRG